MKVHTALLLPALLIMSSAAFAQVTQDQCISAFQSSSAYMAGKTIGGSGCTYSQSSLGSNSTITVEGENCRLSVSCPYGQGFDRKPASGTFSLEDTSKLSNCDGTLKVGPC